MTVDGNSFKPLGKWIAVTTDIGGEKTTESGIIYEDKDVSSGHVWSNVVSVGADVVEDIKDGDKIYWDIRTAKGNHYGGYDLVHEDAVLAVDR